MFPSEKFWTHPTNLSCCVTDGSHVSHQAQVSQQASKKNHKARSQQTESRGCRVVQRLPAHRRDDVEASPGVRTEHDQAGAASVGNHGCVGSPLIPKHLFSIWRGSRVPGRGQVQHGAEESGQPWALRDRVLRGQFAAGARAGVQGMPTVIGIWGHRSQPTGQCRHQLPPWDFTSTPCNLAS